MPGAPRRRRPTGRRAFLLLAWLLAAVPAAALEFDYHDAPLRAVVRDIARAGGLNVLVDAACPDVAVTLRLRDVEPSAALDLVARANGLTVRRAGNAYALHPAGAAPDYGEPAVHRIPVRTDPEALTPVLRAAFPGLALSSAPGALLVVGTMDGPTRARLDALLAELDRPPASVVFRIAVTTLDRKHTKRGALRIDTDEAGRIRLSLDPASLRPHARDARGTAELSGRVSAGSDFTLFSGAHIPRQVRYGALTDEVRTETTSVGESLRVRLLSATPAAISLEIDLDLSALLPGRDDLAVSSRRLATALTLAPGETRVIGGLADERATHDAGALLSRIERAGSALAVTLTADLADGDGATRDARQKMLETEDDRW